MSSPGLLVESVGRCFFCRFAGVFEFEVRLGEWVRFELGVIVGLYYRIQGLVSLDRLDHSLRTQPEAETDSYSYCTCTCISLFGPAGSPSHEPVREPLRELC